MIEVIIVNRAIGRHSRGGEINKI